MLEWGGGGWGACGLTYLTAGGVGVWEGVRTGANTASKLMPIPYFAMLEETHTGHSQTMPILNPAPLCLGSPEHPHEHSALLWGLQSHVSST